MFLTNPKLAWTITFDIVLFLFLAIFLIIFCFKKKILKISFIILPIFLLYAVFKMLSYIYKDSGAFVVSSVILEIFTIFIIAILTVSYHNDFKSIFNRIARNYDNKKLETVAQTSEEELQDATSEIVRACQTFSKKNVGALIIIIKNDIPERILDSGTKLNADITAEILESIFSTKGPLHDGAVLVKQNKILAAGCFLPLSESNLIAQDLGTRHRAAIGVTEETNVLSVVVSEENGVISVAKSGKIRRYMTPESLEDEVFSALKGEDLQDIGV